MTEMRSLMGLTFMSVAPSFGPKTTASRRLRRGPTSSLTRYLRFPPMHSPDRAEDTKKAAATVASGDEQGGASSASENDDYAAARPVTSGSEDEPEGGGQE